MIRAFDPYWDSDRASYEDELNAWRDRTAAPLEPVAPLAPAETRLRAHPRPRAGQIFSSGLPGRLPRAERPIRHASRAPRRRPQHSRSVSPGS